MSKHTPGPWDLWSGYNYVDKIEAQVTAEGGDIVIASYNHLIPEGEANAALMAAAPDLLDALELIAGMHDFESSTGALAMSMYEASCVARAAIKKAKGEQE